MSISLLLKLILELINPSSSGLTTLFELLFLVLIIGLTTSLTLFIGSILFVTISGSITLSPI